MMRKTFNTTAVCIPGEHYMVDISGRLQKIKEMIDAKKYFTINRARQYGKTTTLQALFGYLQSEYYTVLLDFQTFDASKFKDGNIFSIAFAGSFLHALKRNRLSENTALEKACADLKNAAVISNSIFSLKELFECLRDICAASYKPIVLMIDEVDNASNNQVFLDFLAQLRAQYIERAWQPAFQSVILAGVYDIKNLKQKLRADEEHKYNSPWNIAADFTIDMSFSQAEIAAMLNEYAKDYGLAFDTKVFAGWIYDYTAGYPFLVSRLCQLLDEKVCLMPEYASKKAAWTKDGFNAAVRLLLQEKNTLFESLIGKLHAYPKLNRMLKAVLFSGNMYPYSADEAAIDMATMFGFIKNKDGYVAIANRIFETRLYNYYLAEDELQKNELYKASLQDKNKFITNGRLDMELVLQKFIVHFNDIFGSCDERFLEEEGRKYFLLYLRPIINGTGNYYVEARTRDLCRTDVIVDYNGEQYIIEMKIWRGNEYNNRGESQLAAYLDAYHTKVGYLLSFSFNKNKQAGVQRINVGDKVIIEAVV